MQTFGKQRLSQHIIGHMKGLIASGELRAGDKLPTEHTLCENFKVSRTTLREAMTALRQQGLIDVAPGRGSHVCKPEMQQMGAELRLKAALLDAPEHELAALRHTLLRLVLPYAPALSAVLRQSLGQEVLSPNLTTHENAAAEASWQQALLGGTPLETSKMLLDTVLALDTPHRLRRCANPTYVNRVQQLQMRGLQAVSVGDTGGLERLLHNWLGAEALAVAA